jgi:hypothetical protein
MAQRVPNKGKTVLAFKTLSQTFFLRGEEGMHIAKGMAWQNTF